MCGIAGAIGRIDAAILAGVSRMHEAQRHRGPDDEGHFRSFEGTACQSGAVFAFRRLAIIDLSADAHQPMHDPQTGNVIIFNGEIYNYCELRDRLISRGVQFRSQSDTEVLLQAYAQWGIDAVRELRGMFAFAIWDARTRQIILARDRIGIKPLYVAGIDQDSQPINRTILFASELRSILASGLIARRIDPVSLSTFVWNGFVIGPQTIIQGVRMLDAGTIEVVGADGLQVSRQRYWHLPAARKSSHHHAAHDVEALQDTLQTAVKQHLVSDVPLGVFLSGGIDSSAIAALAVQGAGSAVQTFNISFDESEFDESQHARAVAAALGTQHHEVKLTQSAFQQQLPGALNSIDQPTFDAINTYFVSRAVREAGMTVALAGTGGDELFGGYRSFQDIRRAARWSRCAAIFPQSVVQAAARQIARMKTGQAGHCNVPAQTRWGKLADALASRGNVLDLYQTSYALFTRDFAAQLLQGGLNGHVRSGLPTERAAELEDLAGETPSLHAISTLELSCFIGERLLRDTDAASMAVSLEARVPLLDHEVIQAAANIDPRARFQPLGKKLLLRRLALDRLDPGLFERPKSGFVLPLERWCLQELRSELDDTFADASLCDAIGLNHVAVARVWEAFKAGAPGIYWSRVWSLFVLMWWCRRHEVSM